MYKLETDPLSLTSWWEESEENHGFSFLTNEISDSILKVAGGKEKLANRTV